MSIRDEIEIGWKLAELLREKINSAYDESKFAEAVLQLQHERRSNKQTTNVEDNIVVYTQGISKRRLKKFIRKRYCGRFYSLLFSCAKSVLPKIKSTYILTIHGVQTLDMLYRRNCSLAHLLQQNST